MNPYTIEQWLEDYRASLQLTADLDVDPNDVRGQLLDHFCRKYLGDPIQLLRFEQFSRAMIFLEEHLNDFERYVVAGEKASLVREPLIRALHEHFTQASNREPAIEEIKVLAIKHGE